MKLSISGGFHIGPKSEQLERIRDEHEELDAVFIENTPQNNHTDAERRQLLTYAFWITVPMMVYTMLLSILGRIVGSDGELSSDVAEQFDAPIHRVQPSLTEILLNDVKAWGVAMWGEIIAISLFILPAGVPLLRFGGVILALVICNFLLFAVGTSTYREQHMVKKTIEVSNNNDYNEACLIVGKGHESTIAEEFRNDPEIDVVVV